MRCGDGWNRFLVPDNDSGGSLHPKRDIQMYETWMFDRDIMEFDVFLCVFPPKVSVLHKASNSRFAASPG